MLSAFDVDGDTKLYHFRFLPAERRAAAAQYIVDNQLEAPVSGCRPCKASTGQHRAALAMLMPGMACLRVWSAYKYLHRQYCSHKVFAQAVLLTQKLDSGSVQDSNLA